MAYSHAIPEIMKRPAVPGTDTQPGASEKLGQLVKRASVHLGSFISAPIEPS
jgi:hypothetical protein